MIYSQIQITFNEDLSLDNFIQITAQIEPPSSASSLLGLYQVWKNLRIGPNQTTIGTPSDIVGERSAINYAAALSLDYGSSGIFTITQVLNVVTILSNNPYLTFLEFDGTDSDVNFVIIDSEGIVFDVISVDFLEATDKCSDVIISVQTSELATNILAPILVAGNTENPFNFTWPRNQALNFVCKNADNEQANQAFILTPSFFDISAKEVIINNSPTGANVTIYLNSATDLEIEYSLDDATWQESNSFTGLTPDNYTVYVRDQYGCKQNFSVLISEVGINSSYFKIPKSNSIRYANQIVWGDAANYKNDDNTLSFQAFAKDKRLAHKEIQLFQSADVIPTQFRSNYAENLAKVIKADLTEVPVSVIKKSNNIGLKEKRDAKIFSYDTGKTGIYFITGNIYNYDTDVVTGTHNLNGTLPDWAVEGNYIKIGASFYLIESIVYDDSRNSDVIVFSNPYFGTANANQIVGCIYNLKNYEVYEFEIDMVNYLDERIQVRINANDPNFQDLVNISEFIEVAVRHEQTVDIHYWNENNTDMFYATGIKNRIRIPIFDAVASDDEESENHKTDTNSVLLSAEFYEGDEFEFEPQTKEMHRKTKIALSHKFIFIDGVQYIKNGNFESEKLDDSNLYSLKVKMLKAGEPFINNSNNGFEFDSSSEEIPGLIETESGFVKY